MIISTNLVTPQQLDAIDNTEENYIHNPHKQDVGIVVSKENSNDGSDLPQNSEDNQ